MVLEKIVEKKIMLSLSKKGCRIWKNFNGTVFTKNMQPFKVGFGDGSSDLIGLTPVTITKDMVGKQVAIFTAIEVKKSRTGYGATDQQKAFIKVIKNKGGFAGIAYDNESAEEIIKC